jgi:hypothetical protein
MRQGTARGTVLKKPHRYRFYQTKKPGTQRQNFSNRNKFIGSMKTLENTHDNAGLSVLRNIAHPKRVDGLLQRVQVNAPLEFLCPPKTVLPGAGSRIGGTSRHAPRING